MYKEENSTRSVHAIKKMVEQILREEPSDETILSGLDSRDSDITLTIRIWRRFYGVGDSIQLSKLYKLAREDEIKRARARFCHEKKQWAYPTLKKVVRKRGIKEDEWREAMGYPKTEETLNPTRKPSWTFSLPPAFDQEKLEEKRLKEAQAKLF